MPQYPTYPDGAPVADSDLWCIYKSPYSSGTTRFIVASNIKDYIVSSLTSGLSASQAVVTDGSKNLVSYPYASTNTPSSLMARDASGNVAAAIITAATGLLSDNLDTTLGATPLIIGATNANAIRLGKTGVPTTVKDVLNIEGTTNQIKFNTANVTTITAPNPAGARTYTIPDAGASASFIMSNGAQTLNGNTTFAGVVNLSGLTASQAVVTDGSKNLASLQYTASATGSTLVSRDSSGNSTFTNVLASGLDTASPGTLTIGGTNATAVTFVPPIQIANLKVTTIDAISAGTLTIGNGTATSVTINPQLILPLTSNQIVLGTTNTTTITSTAPAASRVYTIPDAGASTQFVMGAGNQTIAGIKTFSGTVNISGLSTSTAVVTDASKNLTSLAYTSSNVASTLVQRDGSNNFSAGTITASLTGAASLNVLKAGDTMTGALTINPASNQLILGGVAASNTTTITSPVPASNRTYTIPDAGTNTAFIMGAGTQTIGGSKTFSSALTISPTSNQLILGVTNTTTINATAPAASRTYTIPDTGTNSSFLMTDGNQTINGTKTFSSGIPISATTNQLVLGTTNTVTITSPAPAASRTYTIPDTGANSNFVMTDGNQTINGNKSLTGTTNITTLQSTSIDTPSAAIMTIGTSATKILLNNNTQVTGNLTVDTINASVAGYISICPNTGLGVNIAPTSNQLTFGGSTKTTITCPTPSLARTYTIADFGGAATFVMTDNTNTTVTKGTWTPTLGDGTNNFTLSTAKGYYERIGDSVYFSTLITWTSIGSATGNLVVSLPFTAMNDAGNYRGFAQISYTQGIPWTSGNKLTSYVGSNVATAFVIQCPFGGGAPTNIACSSCSASGVLEIGGWFRTA